MSKQSKQKFTDKYLIAQDTYKEVNDIFQKFENGEIPEDQLDNVIEDTLSEIKSVQSILRKLNVKDIYGEEYDDDFIQDIKNNIDFMEDAFEHFYEKFMSAKLFDEIIGSVRNYIEDMKLSHAEYRRYAADEKQLADKYTAMLVKHASMFKNQIHRIALGTMNQKEFVKIYKANRNKMIPLYTFESFTNYEIN